MARDYSLHILQHALGLDDYGTSYKGYSPFNTFRAYFVAGEGSEAWEACMAHVEAGRMKRSGPGDLYGGSDSHCFHVTEAGRFYVRENSPKPPKVSRGKQRYREWLRSNCDYSFGEWLKMRRTA